MIDAVAERLRMNFGGSTKECQYEALAIVSLIIQMLAAELGK